MTDQKPGRWKDVLAILRLGTVNEDDGRMFPAGIRTDQRPGQSNGAAREMDIFVFLDLDTPRGTGWETFGLPRQRGDPTSAIALKRDPRFDGGRNRGAGPNEEAVAIRRIKRPHLSGFIKGDELRRLAETANSSHIWRYTNAFGPH